MTGKGVILISGGNSEIGGHIRSNLSFIKDDWKVQGTYTRW